MQRTLIALTSLFATATLFGSTSPAFAASGAAYRLIPAAAVAAANTVVAGETLWKCSDGSCVAAKSTSRPVITCAQAAKKIGKIEAFTANGESLSEADLAKCNEKAK